MASQQEREQRVRNGSKRKRDLDSVPVPGFKPSREPEPRGLVLSAASAVYYASDEDKKRAKEAARRCNYAPFSYNATLLLVAEGKEPTRETILAKATALHAANDRFLGADAKAEVA